MDDQNYCCQAVVFSRNFYRISNTDLKARIWCECTNLIVIFGLFSFYTDRCD